MALRIRVLGVHRGRLDGPIPAWAYYAEAYDERDTHKPPVWACGHEHENLLRAQSCGLDWLRGDVEEPGRLDTGQDPYSERGDAASHG